MGKRRIAAEDDRRFGNTQNTDEFSTLRTNLAKRIAGVLGNAFLAELESGSTEYDVIKPLAPERVFVVKDRISVYQRRLQPPTFLVLENHPGAIKVLIDLDLAYNPGEIYYSCFVGGGDYVGAVEEAHEKCQRFTVELFGKLLRSKDPELLHHDRHFPPELWTESSWELIHVWRKRVYVQPLATLDICPAQPVSPHSPSFPYLESRWHPDRETSLLLGGVEGYKHGFRLLERFYDRAFRVLTKSPFKSGRPKGSGLYSDPYEFWLEVVRVHTRLWIKNGRKPTQPEVAIEMGMALPTFKDNWARTRALWSELPRPS